MVRNAYATRERRDAVVREIRSALTACCPGSHSGLRGSLAAGTADEYSDIDLAWMVPDDRFAACLDRVPNVLNDLYPVESVRSDPDFQNSAKRRLLFVLFRDLPLFWRLDLEIWAASISGNSAHDTDNPAAKGDDWSPAASALTNAIAAVKAVRRRRLDDARGLVDRAFARIGADDRVTGDWAADITRLAGAAARREPGLTSLAGRVRELAAELL